LSQIRVSLKNQNEDIIEIYNKKTDRKFASNTNSLITTRNISDSYVWEKTNLVDNHFSSGLVIRDPRLKKLKLYLSPDSHKQYSVLLTVINEVSGNNCNTLTDFEWFHVIPNRMRQFGYQSYERNHWKFHFHYFSDLFFEVIVLNSINQ
jgi:hypothetical protein